MYWCLSGYAISGHIGTIQNMKLITKYFSLYIDKSVLAVVVYLAFTSRGGL